VEVLVLPRAPLLQFLAEDASASLAIARMLSLRVNTLFDLLFIGVQGRLGARVQAALEHLAATGGQPTPAGGTLLRISQDDLALMVGASRQKVNEQLRALQQRGRVRLGYRWMELPG